ncbi:MAG: PilT protein domain-containing protein [Planctomycetota bacterium]|nr:MAG: PilT protein domain-containing protein [Planctomycetota bacterium]
MLVLDTDHLSLLERPESAERRRLVKRLNQAAGETVVTTIVSYEEQSRGWLAYVARARSKTEQIDAYRRLARHLDAYRSLTVLDFDERAFAEYDRLRKSGVRIGTLDLKIAAIVLAQDGKLLSRNLADFGQVAGLMVEDWLT